METGCLCHLHGPGETGGSWGDGTQRANVSLEQLLSTPSQQHPFLIAPPPHGSSCLTAPSLSSNITLRNTTPSLGHPSEVYTGLEGKPQAPAEAHHLPRPALSSFTAEGVTLLPSSLLGPDSRKQPIDSER